jgi:hypothetical protein
MTTDKVTPFEQKHPTDQLPYLSEIETLFLTTYIELAIEVEQEEVTSTIHATILHGLAMHSLQTTIHGIKESEESVNFRFKGINDIRTLCETSAALIRIGNEDDDQIFDRQLLETTAEATRVFEELNPISA